MISKSALGFGILLVLLWSGCGNNRTFNAAAWQKGSARERGRMAESLVKSGMLVGKSVDEAERLLGKPDFDYGKVIQYKIDLGWLFKSPEHYGLQLHLDNQRSVTLVKIVD